MFPVAKVAKSLVTTLQSSYVGRLPPGLFCHSLRVTVFLSFFLLFLKSSKWAIKQWKLRWWHTGDTTLHSVGNMCESTDPRLRRKFTALAHPGWWHSRIILVNPDKLQALLLSLGSAQIVPAGRNAFSVYSLALLFSPVLFWSTSKR